jgi:glycosyltransferase involved in cell wall biosynthesis
VLLKIKNTGLKFYFVQDCEPLFYPAGSTYAQAELTYRFGFFGICNTETLLGMYEREYGGSATFFKPQVDPLVFHGSIARDNTGPKRIFFYGRPGHARNGFELTIQGMKMLKARLCDQVELICAGAEWDPEEFNLQGIVNNLGLLGYEETGELYRSCHIGFVMMMTRHPSYLPFELMGCGALLVSNVNFSNKWLLKDGENCLLAQPSAEIIADRLEYAVKNYNELEHIRTTGRDLIKQKHSNWNNAFDQVWDFIKNINE